MIRPGYFPGGVVVVNGAQQLFAQSQAIELAGEGSGSTVLLRSSLSPSWDGRGSPPAAALVGRGCKSPEAGRLYAAWMPGALATRILVFGQGWWLRALVGPRAATGKAA
jgi:hypothetical protein